MQEEFETYVMLNFGSVFPAAARTSLRRQRRVKGRAAAFPNMILQRRVSRHAMRRGLRGVRCYAVGPSRRALQRRDIRALLTGGALLTCGLAARAQTLPPISAAPGPVTSSVVPNAAAKPGGMTAAPITPARPAPVVWPSVRVTLSRPVYFIGIDPRTGAARMPHDVTASADVQNWPADLPRPHTFTWHVSLDWNYAPYPTHHDVSKNAYNRPSPFTVDWGAQIRGGALTITAQTPFNGRDIIGQAAATVRGVNPTHDEVLKAFPRTRFGLICSKVAMAESGMRQFTDAKGLDVGGLPEMSRTNDLGIMQLNAPTGSITSQDQIWDWRENVRRGMQELAGKHQTALLTSRSVAAEDRLPAGGAAQLSLLNFYRRFIGLPALTPPRLTPLSNILGSGALPDDPDIDHLALSQLERDAIRRYNGGREYSFRVVPDPLRPDIAFAGWQVDPSRGGLRDRSGDLDYVRHVLRAHSGLTLPPPPPPKKQKGRQGDRETRRHRHTHHLNKKGA